MTTIELEEFAAERPDSSRFVGGLQNMFAAAKRWRERRRTRALLARLSERQLRDLGIEPAEVYDFSSSYAALWEKAHTRP
jgi:uncharacterized protein YjiS (DUF1127 family)